MQATLNGVTYTEANFASPPMVYFANDPVGDELQADTLSVDIIAGTGGKGYVLTADGHILKDADGNIVLTEADGYGPIDAPTAVYGDVIELYNNAGELIAKMYVEGIKRVGRDTYRVSAISALGLLIRRTHYGGIYTGVAASTIFADIMGTVPYTVGGSIGNELIYGHLPIASARDNLHLLLQALGASILKDEDGDILFDYIDTVSVAALDASEIYLGEGTVEELSHATDVVVVEHNFLQTAYDKEVTLFDNTNGASVVSKIVAFDNPCYGLTVTGSLTIDSSDANYAVVTGVGTLVGFEYTHTAEEYELSTGASGEQMTVAVRENELINATNSYNLAMRLSGYYGSANHAEIAAAVSGVRTGHHISFKNVYGEDDDGYVTEAEVALSVGVDKTQFKIATDYEPGPFGANYDSVLVITTSGTWSVPAELTGQHVRIVAIGGSRGGQAGYDGEDGGTWTRENYYSESAQGGNGGAGGLGFKVEIDELDLTNASYLVTIGTGGTGGASDGALGDLGNDTSFGSISSADGVEATGYYDIINAVNYGTTGDTGTAGAAGGRGVSGGTLDVPIKTGGDVDTYDGGNSYYTGSGVWYSGGGGGAALGNNGGDATTATPWPGYFHTNGGDGAAASIVPSQATTLGQGGHGGHGGGGGGLAGGSWEHGNLDDGGTPGAGGAGGQGGQGSDGFILLYYNA